MRIEGFNCGLQVYSTYSEMKKFLDSLEKLKLPISEGYAKFPAHNPIFNAMMDMVGGCLGWQSHGNPNQPFVIPEKGRSYHATGDLAKTMEDGLRVFVEIEIGNEARVFADLVKFDVASKLETFDFFIFILPGKIAASKLGYAMDFSSFLRKREFFKKFISVPLIVVEIEPESEFDLNPSNGGRPVGKGARWGMNQSKSHIRDNNLQSSLGIIQDCIGDERDDSGD